MSIVIPVGEDLDASITNSHAAEYHYNSGGGQGGRWGPWGDGQGGYQQRQRMQRGWHV